MRFETRQVSILLFLTYLSLAVPIIYSIYEYPNDLAQAMGLDITEVNAALSNKTSKLVAYVITELTVGLLGMLYLTKHLNDGKKSNDSFNVGQKENDIILPYTSNKESESIKEDDTKDELTRIKEIEKRINARLATNFTCSNFLSAICNEFQFSQGAFFITEMDDEFKKLSFKTGYAYHLPDGAELKFAFGEGLAGQSAKSQRILNIKSVPDNYIKIISGLGKATPNNLLVIPIIEKEETSALIEFSSFTPLNQQEQSLIQKIAQETLPELIDEFK